MNDIFSITIGRELGSGGKQIAEALARQFDCQLYDKELLALAAKKSGFSEKLFERQDEKHGRLHNLLFNKVPIIGHANYYSEGITQGSLFQFQSEVIWNEAKEKRCVFLGRCADYVLRENPRHLNIFIYADLDFRIENVMKRHNCSADEARKFIKEGERKRAEFYNYYTGQEWGDKKYYNVCIDSSLFGIETSTDILTHIIDKFLAKS